MLYQQTQHIANFLRYLGVNHVLLDHSYVAMDRLDTQARWIWSQWQMPLYLESLPEAPKVKRVSLKTPLCEFADILSFSRGEALEFMSCTTRTRYTFFAVVSQRGKLFIQTRVAAASRGVVFQAIPLDWLCDMASNGFFLPVDS